MGTNKRDQSIEKGLRMKPLKIFWHQHLTHVTLYLSTEDFRKKKQKLRPHNNLFRRIITFD